ncbi:MAG: hypothetical protein AABX13_05370 [Nanoarchaeota archaeon]
MKLYPVLFLIVLFIFLTACLPWQPRAEPITDDQHPSPQQLSQNLPSEQPLSKKSAQQPFIPNKIQQSQLQFPLEVTATITYPATIMGKAGFLPAELTIEVGDSVTWLNADPRKKTLTLTFQEGKTRNFITSPSIIPAAEWVQVFTEPAEYRYWTVGYGVTGKLVVKGKE